MEKSTRLAFLVRCGWRPVQAPGVARRYWADPNDPKRILLAGEAYNVQMARESRVHQAVTGRGKSQRSVYGKK